MRTVNQKVLDPLYEYYFMMTAALFNFSDRSFGEDTSFEDYRLKSVNNG
jgi:hypothetical protein